MKNIFFISLFLIFSCGTESSYNDSTLYKENSSVPTSMGSSETTDMSNKIQNQSISQNQNKLDTDKKVSKIIKDGQINLEVDHISKAKTRIDTLLSKYHAYYGREHFDKSSYQSTYSLEIRVPSKNFEKLISDIESGQGEIKSKNINANDVTESYYDIVTRLENKRAYRKQYQVLLQKASTIKEILEVQEKIRHLTEEIDSSVGKLKYMDDKVSFSTLSLQIFQTHEQKYQPRKRHFLNQISRSFRNGFQGFLDFTLVIISIWPFIFIFLGLWIFRKRINFRFWKRRSK